MTKAFSNRNREGSTGEDYPEPTEVERLRASNAALLAALKAQGTTRGRDGWHLRDCRLGKRRDGLPSKQCSSRCRGTRAAIAAAEKE